MSQVTDPSTAVAVGREEAAALLGISVRMLDELVRRGEIPSFTIGRRRLFAVQALHEWARAKGRVA